jgi:quinol monooxygenase YgiN
MAIRVVARIVALPDKINQLRAVLLELIAPTRNEVGCITYELLQNLSDPTDFTFVEEWSSNEDLEAHLQSSHIAAAIGKLDGLVMLEPDIRRYELLI